MNKSEERDEKYLKKNNNIRKWKKCRYKDGGVMMKRIQRKSAAKT